MLWWALKIVKNIGGNRKKINNEYELLAKIQGKLDNVIQKYSGQEGYASVVNRLRGLKNTLMYQSGRVPGEKKLNKAGRMKKKWPGYEKAEHREINGVGRRVQTTADEDSFFMRKALETDVMRDRKDWPLFAHRPTYDDIVQGAAGNCFFLAALASIPSDKIREMMLDNGDGTVTVRFYEYDEIADRRKPVYVTVDKNVKINASLDCLWVQVMEKAYSLFLQDRAANIFVYTQRTTTDPETGEKKSMPAKTLPENVIDLGYLANGGQSHNVISDFLGTEAECIDIYTHKQEKSLNDVCMEALQQSDERGAAYLEIARLQNKIDDASRYVRKVLESMGINFLDVKTIKGEMQNIEASIKAVRTAMDEAKTENEKEQYRKKLEKNEKDLRELYEEFKPIRGVMHEYWAEAEKHGKTIAELRKKYNIKENEIKEGEKLAGDAEVKLYGMEEETKLLEDKSMEWLKNNTDLLRGDEKEIEKGFRTGVRVVANDFLPLFIEENKAAAGKDLKLNNPKDYEDFVRTMIRSVKEKDKVFMKVMKNDVSLKSVLNNDLDVAVQLMSEFAVPLLEKMIPNIKKIDGVPRSEEIGDGDDEADAVFEKIRTMLKEKRSICVGTDEVEGDAGGIGGEHLKSGVVGTHAYTVLDATVTKSGAKLIKLRNPWASYTVGYKKNSKGALEAEAVKTDNNGIFWIELNHFVSHVNQIFGSAQP